MKNRLLAIICFMLSHRPAALRKTPPARSFGAPIPMAESRYVFLDPNDPETYIGVEVDLAQAISRVLRRPIELRKRTFENLISDVETRRHRHRHERPRNPPRAAQSRPVHEAILPVSTPARRQSRFALESFKEFEENKLPVGTLGATAASKLLKDRMIPFETYDDQDGPYTDLSIGRRIQGVLLDLPAAIYYAAPDHNLKYSRRIKACDSRACPLRRQLRHRRP